ncbi:MAG: hypothetical protein NTY38_01725 [Acidobacteria bacterium]|nr:hypothetical protein [Acidobacteriota bacterium]
MSAALCAGLAGELESPVTATSAALETMLGEIRKSGEPVDEALGAAAVALRSKAMELHVMLEYLAAFESGWAALIHSQREGYTESGGAAMRTDPTAVWVEA